MFRSESFNYCHNQSFRFLLFIELTLTTTITTTTINISIYNDIRRHMPKYPPTFKMIKTDSNKTKSRKKKLPAIEHKTNKRTNKKLYKKTQTTRTTGQKEEEEEEEEGKGT